MHRIVITPWTKALTQSSRREPKKVWKVLGVLGGAVGVLLGLAQSGCGAEPVEVDPKSDEMLGEADQAIATTCLGGIDANGTALGPVAPNTSVCGSGNKSWRCNASGQWQYEGVNCSVGNVPSPPSIGCSGGSLADGTPLGVISPSTTVCGDGFKTYLCDASAQWQNVGADCTVASCSNGVLDPGETATDCGGACLCAGGQFCLTGANCASGSCSSNVCTPACVPGAVQSQTCSGYALTQVVYTSVNCATTTQLVQACSAQCGAPPAGQQLGAAFCSGVNLYASFTNGSCGASDQLVQANAAQCAPPVASGSNFSIYCVPASGQNCTNPRFTQTVTTTGALTAQYDVSQGHCSSVRVILYVDDMPVYTSGYLGWYGGPSPLSTGVVNLGSVTPGTHTVSISAEGQVGGCNFGNLVGWGGTLSVTGS